MSDTRTTPVATAPTTARLTLPVVPLTSTVVLPGAVVTLALDSDDGRRAAAQRPPGRRPRPPRPPGRGPLRQGRHRSPTSRTWASCPTAPWPPSCGRSSAPASAQAWPAKGCGSGRRSSTTRPRLRPSARSPVSCAVVLEQIAEQRRSRRLPEILRTVHEPGRAGRRRDVVGRPTRSRPSSPCSRPIDVDARLQLVLPGRARRSPS